MTHSIATLVATAMLGIVAASPAWADFRFQAATPYPTASPATPAPVPDGTRPESPFKIAHGFGRDVPLDFAARQIVPRGVTVSFGKGVDPSSTISWKGEAPWNRVLAAAVRPLHLRIITGATTVLIAR